MKRRNVGLGNIIKKDINNNSQHNTFGDRMSVVEYHNIIPSPYKYWVIQKLF